MTTKPYAIPSGRTLIIPDIHQDIEWVRSILRQENDNWDHLVFLGDYFDPSENPSEVAPACETAAFLLKLEEIYEDRVTFLLGNHDIPYMEMLLRYESGRMPKFPLNNCGSFSRIRLGGLMGILRKPFIQRFCLFVECNGWLISHAGVHPKFWSGGLPGVDDPLESLNNLCKIALKKLTEHRVPILGCGAGRGGLQDIGGITWLDWRKEFEDDPRLPPQIVGHTPSRQGL